MARIFLYKVNDKISVENNVLGVISALNTTNTPIQEEIITDLSPNWIKNINRLNNEITLYLEGRNPLKEYNYLRIQDLGNTTPNIFFFFITGYEERGLNQVTYKLQMDTLNTYRPEAFDGIKYEDSLGLVLREHKDRFFRRINQQDLRVFKNNLRVIEDVNIIGDAVKSANTENETIRQRLVLKKYGEDGLCVPLYFWKPYNEVGSVNYGSTMSKFRLPLGWGFSNFGDMFTTTIYEGENISLQWNNLINSGFSMAYRFTSNDLYYIIEFHNFLGSNPNIPIADVNSGWQRGELDGINGSVYYREKSSIDPTNIYLKRGNPAFINTEIVYNLGITRDTSININTVKDLNGGIVQTFNYINENDVNNIKIVELFDIFVNHSTENIFKNLIPFGAKLNNYQDKLQSNYFKNGNDFIFAGNIDDLRIEFNEPKLYTSQFEPSFLTLSGESIPTKWENIISTSIAPEFTITLSDNDYSKAMLNMVLSNWVENDYLELTKTIDLNNDIPVIITEMEKYIQTLQQNDLKMMNLQQAASTRNLQKQRTNIAASAAVGFAGGAMLGNPITAGVGAAAGVITGVINFSYSVKEAKAQDEMRRIEYNNKLINIQNSLLNIVGSPINLKRINNLDRPKQFIYELTLNNKRYLDDYFFYYGYKTNEIKKPVLKTREKFDFKQIIFKELKCRVNLEADIKNDILRRWEQGVTIYHKIPLTLGSYDYEQKYENREVSLL